MRMPTVAAFVLYACASASAQEVPVIVGFHGEADGAVFERVGGKASLRLEGLRAWAGRVPAGRLRALRTQPGVLYVEEDLVRRAIGDPNDTYYLNPGLNHQGDASFNHQKDDFDLVRAAEAWDVSKGTGVRVAVLDTGCQTTHPDLAAKIKAARNFTGGSASKVSDNDGHGTHTAGSVGALTNNGSGVAGMGYDCELAIGKVLGPQGGYDSWIAAGMAWSYQTAGAKVISMSLGGYGFSQTLENATNAAWDAGVVVVAAAGNDGADAGNHYPSASPNCISVAAVDPSGAMASFSNHGESVDLAAPGVKILSTYPNGYAWLSGTSMATPHVAGAAALVWATPHGDSAANVRGRLEGMATRAATGARAGGIRILDARAAVEGPAGPVDGPPSAAIASPSAGAVVSGETSILVAASDPETALLTVEVRIDGGPWQPAAFLGDGLYAFVWNTTLESEGGHLIEARSTDGAAQTTDAAPVAVTVDNLPDPAFAAFDGFESGTFDGGTGWAGAWTKAGSVGLITSAGPRSGSWHARFRGGSGRLERSVVSAGGGSLTLRFWAKVESFEAGDQAQVRVSVNGAPAGVVKTFTAADGNGYAPYEIALGPVSGTLTLSFVGAMNQNSDYWYVDDVEIVAAP
jgi:subtilisin family serine protease